MSVGDTDLNYLINGNGTYVRSALPNWFPNNSDSKLIWIDAGRDNYTTYSFVLNFDLTGFDLASVVIGGRSLSDNNLIDILINGVSAGGFQVGNWKITLSTLDFRLEFPPYFHSL